MPSILANLRRSRERSRSKTSSVTSSSKAKPLDILPGLTELSEHEEDERTASVTSLVISPPRPKPQTRSSLDLPPVDPSAKKRSSRRVVLTGVEGLSFEDFFPLQPPRPAPSPPSARPSSAAPTRAQSPLDSINLRFSGLHFPFSGVPTTPESLRSVRSSSPTPSCASSASASTVSSAASASSPRIKVLTPPTSDDECQEGLSLRLTRAPTVKSYRGTIGYVPGARKQRSASEKSFVDMQLEEDEDEAEDASWFAQDMSDSFVLSPFEEEQAALARTPAGSLSKANGRGRKTSTSEPMSPSAQLDPAFPAKRKSYIPNRPPPPPPIRIIDVDSGTNVFIAPPTPPESKPSPTMEEKTEELLALLANAALATTSLNVPAGPSRLSCISNPVTPMSTTPHSCAFIVPTPTIARPPPRFVPADITEIVDPVSDSPATITFGAADLDALDLGALELEWTPDSDDDESLPPTPRSTDILLPMHELTLDAIPLAPATPAGSCFYVRDDDADFRDAALPDSPCVRSHEELSKPPLRSRWSTSTLAESTAGHRASGWRDRFAFGAGRKSSTSPTKTHFALKSPTRSSFGIARPAFGSPKKSSAPAPAAPSKRVSAPSTPEPAPSRTPRTSPPRPIARRASDISLCSSDSGDSVCSTASTGSTGLRRKPIPVEIFMRA